MDKKLIALLVGIVLVIQLISLSRVGFTWDETTIYFFGKRTFDFWAVFPAQSLPDYSPESKVSDGPFQYVYNAIHYPPFVPFLGAISDFVFREKLQLTSIVVSYHIPLVVIGSVGAGCMFVLLRLLSFSSLFSFIGSLVFITYPTIWGQMRNDAKDVPVAMGLTGTVASFLYLLRVIKRRKNTTVLLAVFLLGVAMALTVVMKPTGGIIIPILLCWGILSLLFQKERHCMKNHWRLFFVSIVSSGILALVLVLLSWPWLWEDPVAKLQTAMTFFRSVGFDMPVEYFGDTYFAGKNVPWHYPLGILAVQTPPLLLVLAILGAFYSVYLSIKQKTSIHIIFLLWFVLGISRFFIPSVIIYAKVRHFLDIMPAFFVLVMYGIFFFQEYLKKIRLPLSIGLFLGLVLIVHHLFISVTYFPYEPSYFSMLVGGGKGVADNKLFDIEYWGSSTREAMEKITSVEKNNVYVYACGMGHLAKYFTTPNVRITADPTVASYIIIPNSPSYFSWVLKGLQPNHTLFYTISRSGADLAWVYYHTEGPPLPGCGPESEVF